MPDDSQQLANVLAKKQRSEEQLSVGNDANSAGYQKPLRTRTCRKRQERGLPSRVDLIRLAAVYLEQQHRHWPVLATFDNLLPANRSDQAERLAQDFADRFLSGNAAPFTMPAIVADTFSGKGLSACYLRYSCENSNPRSLDDQLSNILAAARTHQQFIPWEYVLADSSVSGTLAIRRGYLMAKDLIIVATGPAAIQTLYVYDMTRASRDIIESHRLARLFRNARRNIIGVADGFDLNSSHADMQLMGMSMCSQILIGNTRHRVSAGMIGTARRGTSTGKPPFGYKLVPVLDASGVEQTSKWDKVLKHRVIDETTAPFVEMAFRMVGIEHQSYEKVREVFNTLKVGGKNNWWPLDIRTLLKNPVYIGVYIFNRKQTITDPETGKSRDVERPRKEWVIIKKPEWRIVSDELWKAARRRCQAVRDASPLKNRSPVKKMQLFPKTILSGNIICAHCGIPLTLGRGGVTKFFRCTNGQRHIAGCKLRSKKAAFVEEAILAYIRDQLLTSETANRLVVLANNYLAEEAARSKVDTGPLQDEIRRVSSEIEALTDSIATRSTKAVTSIVNRIEQCDRQLSQLRSKLREIDAFNGQPPPPLTVEGIQNLISSLREVLNQAPEVAGPVLRRLTGPISVMAHEVPGKKHRLWVAAFKNNLIPVLSDRARAAGKTPESYGLDLLSLRKWIFEISGTIEMLAVPRPDQRGGKQTKYKCIANSATQLRDAGHPWIEVAESLGVAVDTAMIAYVHARTGLSAVEIRRRGLIKLENLESLVSSTIPSCIQSSTPS